MTYGMTSCSNQATADWSAAVAMTATTLRSRVRQMRADLQRLRTAQLDCCNCVRQTIEEAMRNIEVGGAIDASKLT